MNTVTDNYLLLIIIKGIKGETGAKRGPGAKRFMGLFPLNGSETYRDRVKFN
jgi:hypothetical protein